MAPLPAVIPLFVAAVLAALGRFLHRRVLDAIALATSAAVLIISIFLTIDSSSGVIVYWFGGWRPTPQSHFPLGICFMIDPFGAGMASLVSLLVLTAFTFSWSYFESVKALYHVLMLAFLGAMCGLCLTGDLFNMFVWFELMTATAVALCGYKSEESQSLQGALNFAVTNTIGAFLSLTGIALLYAFTGSLNMAEIGRTLAVTSPAGRFLTVAFLFVIAGFLVKSASFPFHFWLADAHAVAPTPVCILFSGVMVELGLYAIARIYWVVFAGSSQPAAHSIRVVFLVMGSLTAVLGSLYCFGQRQLKRLLAFSTISHVGLMLLGFALVSSKALAGLALYLIGHGMVKGSLFIGAGILLHRFRSVDEYDLFGKAGRIMPVGLMMILGAWGLAGLPPFATFVGDARIEQSASQQGLEWLSGVVIFAEAFTAAAVLRFTARAFFGVGHRKSLVTEGAPHMHMDGETRGSHSRVPVFMWAPMAALLAGAIIIGFPLRASADKFANVFEDTSIYYAAVLGSSAPALHAVQRVNFDVQPASPDPWWTRVVAALAMIGIAAASLFPKSRKIEPVKPIGTGIAAMLAQVRTFQSGRAGDYVAWFAFGIAAYGGLLLLMR